MVPRRAGLLLSPSGFDWGRWRPHAYNPGLGHTLPCYTQGRDPSWQHTGTLGGGGGGGELVLPLLLIYEHRRKAGVLQTPFMGNRAPGTGSCFLSTVKSIQRSKSELGGQGMCLRSHGSSLAELEFAVRQAGPPACPLWIDFSGKCGESQQCLSC